MRAPQRHPTIHDPAVVRLRRMIERAGFTIDHLEVAVDDDSLETPAAVNARPPGRVAPSLPLFDPFDDDAA